MKSFNRNSLKLVVGFLGIIFLGIAVLAAVNSQKPEESVAASIKEK